MLYHLYKSPTFDKVKVKADKCVLRAFSETFKYIVDDDIPLIYMRGTKSRDVK